MRKRYVAGLVLALASIVTLDWARVDRPGIEEQIARSVIEERIRSDATRCPLGREALARSPSWLLAACADGGPGWYEAAARYGDAAARVYLVYGAEPVLADIFERFGHPVVPVIAYFMDNGSTQYRIGETIGGGLARFIDNGPAKPDPAALTPEQYGLLAIEELGRRGHEMLSEFEVVDGVAVRRPFTRALLGAKNLLFGGMTDVERVLARGERLPSWSEIGWAALDAAILVGGVGAATKTLRAARLPAQAAGRVTARAATLRAAGAGVTRSLVAVGRAAGVTAALALPYVAITRPHLVSSAAGWLAERAGLPVWSGVLTVWLAIAALLAAIVRWMLMPMTFAARGARFVLGRCVHAARGIAWLARPALAR